MSELTSRMVSLCSTLALLVCLLTPAHGATGTKGISSTIWVLVTEGRIRTKDAGGAGTGSAAFLFGPDEGLGLAANEFCAVGEDGTSAYWCYRPQFHVLPRQILLHKWL